MIGTPEEAGLRGDDKVIVSLGSGGYEAEVVNADDPAKLRVKLLGTGSGVWVGRKAVVDLVNND